MSEGSLKSSVCAARVTLMRSERDFGAPSVVLDPSLD